MRTEPEAFGFLCSFFMIKQGQFIPLKKEKVMDGSPALYIEEGKVDKRVLHYSKQNKKKSVIENKSLTNLDCC